MTVFFFAMTLICSQGGFGGTLTKIDIKVRINHEGEVNKARAMPQSKVSADHYTHISNSTSRLLFKCYS